MPRPRLLMREISGVLHSIPLMMPSLRVRALRASPVAIASWIDVASRLYSKKMNTTPVATSNITLLNIVIRFTAYSGFPFSANRVKRLIVIVQ